MSRQITVHCDWRECTETFDLGTVNLGFTMFMKPRMTKKSRAVLKIRQAIYDTVGWELWSIGDWMEDYCPKHSDEYRSRLDDADYDYIR